MSRWDAPSDYDYQEENGNPVPRQAHSEKPRWNIPTLAEMQAQRRATPKGKPAVLAKAEKKKSREDEAKAFRDAVWKRDGGKCRATGQPLGKSGLDDTKVGEVDHALLRSTTPDQVFNVTNGILIAKRWNRLRKAVCVRAPEFKYFDYRGPTDRGQPQHFLWRDDDGKVIKERLG